MACIKKMRRYKRFFTLSSENESQKAAHRGKGSFNKRWISKLIFTFGINTRIFYHERLTWTSTRKYQLCLPPRTRNFQQNRTTWTQWTIQKVCCPSYSPIRHLATVSFRIYRIFGTTRLCSTGRRRRTLSTWSGPTGRKISALRSWTGQYGEVL